MDHTFTDLQPIIQWHAGAAMLALVIGPFALWRRRRDRLHRALGMSWMLLMMVVATTAWFINDIRLLGPFSPIHLFAIWTYWSLCTALRHVKAGRYRAHGTELKALYLSALGIAGIFTLLPGRDLNLILFGGAPWAGLLIMAVLGLGLVALWRVKPRLEMVR